MQFQPGQSGNPEGKPKGAVSGRTQLVKALDRLLQDEGNQQALLNGLEASLQKDPVWFFRRIVMPLLPKEATLSLENDGVFTWKLLSDTAPIEDSPEFISQRQDSALSAPDGDSARPYAWPAKLPSGEFSTPGTMDG